MSVRHYYNEWDPYAAQWLRNLIASGHLPAGDVDERSIVDVQATDLVGYTQCHLFAGIGGWPLACRLAGWPDDRPLWTGSCPCPPFSAAGRKKACPRCGGTHPVPCPRRTGHFICCECSRSWLADERHLWPEVWRLIRGARPVAFAGEQVASSDGRVWLSSVRASLEILGYACWGADLCAAGVGAPHIRQRLWFVAESGESLGAGGPTRRDGSGGTRRAPDQPAGSGDAGELADAFGERLPEHALLRPRGSDEADTQAAGSGAAGDVGHAEGDDEWRMRDGEHTGRGSRLEDQAGGPGCGGNPACGMVYPVLDGAGAGGRAPEKHKGQVREGRRIGPESWDDSPTDGLDDPVRGRRSPGLDGAVCAGRPAIGVPGAPWCDAEWIPCRDAKRGVVWRPVEPGTFPLAAGVSARVGRLRAYGNSIVPQVAAQVLAAWMEVAP